MPGDLFSKLKNLFVIEEDVPSAKKSPNVSSEPVKKENKPTYILPESSLDGEIDQKYLELLFKALEENNPDGFDYLEFKEALNSLESVDMDQGTRLKSALAVANSMGADPEKLVLSANNYLSVLEQEEQKFQSALDGQVETKLSAKDEAIKKMQLEIDQKESEIKQLESQITQLQEETSKKQEELNQATSKLQSVHKDFDRTYNFLYSQIKKDIELLTQAKN